MQILKSWRRAVILGVIAIMLGISAHAATQADWTGTTSQNRPISFTITGNQATDIKIEFGIDCGFAVVTINATTSSAAILEDSFTVSISTSACNPMQPWISKKISFVGTFTDDATCDGAWNYTGGGSGTWQAFPERIPLMGDVDGNGQVELFDAVLGLQVVVGHTPSPTVDHGSDVNSDGKIGIEEIVYILQNVSGTRAVPELYDPVGVWNGTIHDATIAGSGIMVNWELKDNKSMLGNWIFYPGIGGAISLNIDGSYSFDTNEISFSTTGLATYSLPGSSDSVSNYTLTVNGSMTSSTAAEGIYSVDFTDPRWPDNSGSWSVTKTLP